MKRINHVFFIMMLILTICFAASSEVRADQDLLMDILLRKGIITEREAREIRDEVLRKEEERNKKQKEELVKEIKDKGLAVPKPLKGLKFEVLGFIDYSNGKLPGLGDNEYSYNRFTITRGYFTVKKVITPWLRTRMTIDTHQDSTGDWKERLKYLYAEFTPPDFGFFTNMKCEIGLGHIPWLDFEERINPYRCQGTMAIERAGVFNSADLGISLRGYFGQELEGAKQKTGNRHYSGRYGSWHIGIYNGPGYHSSEDNNNKVIEGRLTLRPLPDFIPGLQLSYFGICGDGNKKASNGEYPDYNVNMFMLSYEHPIFIFTGQYFQTEGNAKGSWLYANGDALHTAGYSIFADYKLPIVLFSKRRLHVFARYDHFDQDDDDNIASDTEYDMFLAGLAYDIYNGNKFLIAFETTDYGDDANEKHKVPIPGNTLGDDYKLQAVLQIKF
nr:hypothetical protein [Desulfobacterales bacterium]